MNMLVWKQKDTIFDYLVFIVSKNDVNDDKR